MPATAALGLLLVLGFAQPALVQTASAQSAPPTLTLFKDYHVNGDYVIGSVGLRGLGDSTGFATGTINIPDTQQQPFLQPGVPTAVPPGADIVAAFLYWGTVEKSQSALDGQHGFFNSYAITGTILGNPNAPPSWSSGGCSGSSNGTTTMRTYRADVRPFLPVVNGGHQGNGSFQVRLADSGSNGGGAPLTLGATLVIIYRLPVPPTSTTPPPAPLNSVVLYDGAVAPSNGSSTFSQQIVGFYQAAALPVAKITHIVGNGKSDKIETVFLNNTVRGTAVNLPSLYPGAPPFPGFYNQNSFSPSGGGSWDSPTWIPNNYLPVGTAVVANDFSETTSVMPAKTNTGCVNWGAVIFSTTVPRGDDDGLLPVWKAPLSGPPGYTDVKDGTFVPLPGAVNGQQDLFVQLDYLVKYDSNDNVLHSHLPKQAALDMVGDAFWAQGIHVHFDVGNNYQTTTPVGLQTLAPDRYIVPFSSTDDPALRGGHIIAESAVTCQDNLAATPPFYCQFPGEAATNWKGSFTFLKNQPLNYPDEASCETRTLPGGAPGSGPLCVRRFRHNRRHSYHEVIFGHALGRAATNFSAALGMLTSIVNAGTTATVTTKSAHGISSGARVTVSGAIADFHLNRTYLVQSVPSTTTFTITTTNVTDGTYDKNKNPGLVVAFGPATSNSGWADVRGGDAIVTFGKWHWDDPAGCQPNPAVPLGTAPAYCNDQVGTVHAQANTLMHEMGHNGGLTHGAASIIPTTSASGTPGISITYGPNCEPNFQSAMNYLFQFHGSGLPGYDGLGHVNYSGQVLPDLNEAMLDESKGIGAAATVYRTRWFAPLNFLDSALNTAVGGRAATIHCNGTPLTSAEIGTRVLVEGPLVPGAIDWNNDGNTTDTGIALDVNFNGNTTDSPFTGFNDWLNIDLREIGARRGALGFSADVWGGDTDAFGGDADAFGGDTDAFGGDTDAFGGDTDAFGGDTDAFGGGVPETDFDLANATVDPPIKLTAVEPAGEHFVNLNWFAPDFGRIRTYYIWRADTTDAPISPTNLPVNVKNVTGTPPQTFTTDSTVKNGVTYTYFVTAALGVDSGRNNGNQSGPSNMRAITINFLNGATGQ